MQSQKDGENILTNVDKLDQIPGMKSWKIVTILMFFVGLILVITGIIYGTIFKRDHLKVSVAIEDKETNELTRIGTTWNWVHFIGYFLLALAFPDSWLIITLLGIGWEMFECLLLWDDWRDILYNTAGIAAGVAVRKLLIPGVEQLSEKK